MQDRIEEFWVVRYIPNSGQDFFRVFTSWGKLLWSMSKPEEVRNPSWNSEFEIYFVNTSESWREGEGAPRISNVTESAILQGALGYSPTEEERAEEEPASWPHR